MEKETVRTNVILAMGAVTPSETKGLDLDCATAEVHRRKPTSEETPELLRIVCLPYAVREAGVVVRLHPRLDAVEREGGQGRQHARGRGGHFDAVPLDPALGRTPLSDIVTASSSMSGVVSGSGRGGASLYAGAGASGAAVVIVLLVALQRHDRKRRVWAAVVKWLTILVYAV